MAGVFCLSPKKKTEKEEAMGKGEQAAVRRESLLQLARFLRPDSEVQHLSLSFPMLLVHPQGTDMLAHLSPST